MWRSVLGGGLAALSLILSTPAGATQMLATIVGDYNDNPTWFYWQVEIRYDSDLGVVDSDPDISTFSWNAAMGGPSPVSSVTGFVVSKKEPPFWWIPEIDGPYIPPPDHHFSFTDVTSVEFVRATTFDSFEAAGPGWALHLGDFDLGVPHATDLRFDTPWSREIEEYGLLDVGAQGGSFAHVHGVTVVTRLGAVPEPATWGLMIFGFGLAGAMLRRRRMLSSGAGSAAA